MGRIDQDYSTDATITGADKVIGTDAADSSTKNFTIDGIKGYMENNLTGASSTYTSLDGKTVTSVNGLTTSIAAATINTDATVTANDLLRGVDSADGVVKNYTVESVKDYTLNALDVDNLVYTVYDNIVMNNTTDSTTTVLDYGVNVIVTSTGTDYACKLPQPVTGKKVTVINKSPLPIKIFPSNVGGQINNYAIDAPATVPNDGKSYEFICIENPLPGEWTWDAPATAQIELAEIEVSHTNGVVTSVTGTTTANLGSSSAGVDGSGNLSLTGSWLTEPVETTFTKLKSYTNILQSDIASDSIPDTIYVNLNTAFKTGASSSTIGARATSSYRGGASFTGSFAPTGTLNSPVSIGDTNTMYDELIMSNANGVSDQLGLGGDFSRYYYNFGFYIPASAATKTYKFKIYVEIFTN